MDKGTLEGDPFQVKKGAFTVEAWVRHHGPGSIPGPNIRESGTLIAVGDGHWSGWRLSMRFPQSTLSFEIGRPGKSGPARVTGMSPVAEDVWHHVVATWDGQEMRLYLNGLLAGVTEYSGDFHPSAPESRFRVGFVGNGLGSVSFDLDELVIYDDVLTPRVVLRHALSGKDPDRALAERLIVADEALHSGAVGSALEIYLEVSSATPAASPLGGLSRLRSGECYREVGDFDAAFEQFASLAAERGAGATYRQSALVELMSLREKGSFLLDRPDVYRRLLQSAFLSPGANWKMRLDLARALRKAGHYQTALAEYDESLALEGVARDARLEVQLERARTLDERGDARAAREAFRAIAEDPGAPFHYRGIAVFEIGESLEGQGRHSEAAAWYGRVARDEGFPAHLVREARERSRQAGRLARGLPPREPPSRGAGLSSRSPAVRTFFVAPWGAAGGAGSRERPFGTLEQARDAVRELRRAPGMRDARVDVVLRGGVYPIRAPFELTDQDSGSPSSPVVYRAAVGETPMLSGGMVLSGVVPLVDSTFAARFPVEARDRILQVDLRSLGLEDFPQLVPRGVHTNRRHPVVTLYENGDPMTLARWPDGDWTHTGSVGESEGERAGFSFVYTDSRPEGWESVEDVWVHGYWRHLWADDTLEVEALDRERRVLRTRQTSPRYGIREGQPYYYFNVPEELDSPGEWYLDRKSGVLYLYPAADPADASYVLGIADGPLVHLRDASHLALENLIIEHSRGTGVIVDGGEGVRLQGLNVRNHAGDGIAVDGGRNHGVLACDIHTTGRSGVALSGGERRSLAPAGHFVENCRIRNFSRIVRGGVPAVLLQGVGSRVAQSLISDGPGRAILLAGNDHLVEFNEIHHVVLESDDIGALDMHNDPSYRGNVIRFNYWHHIGNGHPIGQNAVRLDDGICGTLVYGNVFYRAAGGRFGAVNINGGKDNWIDNNVFVECSRAISVMPRTAEEWQRYLGKAGIVDKLTGRVEVDREPFASRYPELTDLSGSPSVNHVWRNLAFRCDHFLSGDGGNQDVADNFVSWKEPHFVDLEDGSVRLRDVPVGTEWTSFFEIPFESIGPY